MKVHQYSDLKHKSSPARQEQIRHEAKAELERMGFGKLRQARHQTQVALAERLDVPQAAISRLERRTDLLLSTLRGYVEGLGGRLELRAVFPDGEFLLETLAPAPGLSLTEKRKSALPDMQRALTAAAPGRDA